MHAVELARSFGIGKVIVPRYSSVFSAVGCVSAEMSYTRQQTVRMDSSAWDRERLEAIRGAARAELAAPIHAAGEGEGGLRITEVASLRYRGQSYAVEIEEPALDDPERLGGQFLARHEALFGFATDEPWELVSLRIRVSAPRGNRIAAAAATGEGEALPTRVDECWFGAGGAVTTPRYAREHLGRGQRITGPAVIEDEWSTVVLPPASALAVDDGGHLHIAVEEAA